MIEKLLRYPNMPSPYLGESRPVEPSVTKASFQALVKAPSLSPAPAPLKSASQHLQISIQARSQVDGQNTLTPQHDPSNKLQQQLSQTVRNHVLNHPVQTKYSEAYIQELMLLHTLTRVARQQRPPEMLIPSQSAMLSSVPVEKSWRKDKPNPNQLKVGGRAFVHFRFAWEDEFAPDSEPPEDSSA